MTSSPTLSATDFKVPAVTLSGVVDYEMYVSFPKQFAAAERLAGQKFRPTVTGSRFSGVYYLNSPILT